MNHLLPALCASITGLTLGIAICHKVGVEQAPTAQPQAQQLETTEETSSFFQPRTEEHTAPAKHTNSSRLEKQLNQLLAQQKAMQTQQADLNRELNEIQFRLDTHSASFRPLISEKDTEVLTSGVITPEDSAEGFSPLLPPRQ